MKNYFRLLIVLAIVVSVLGFLVVPARTYAASSVGPTQCADKKVNCNKKGGGQNGQGGSQPAQNTTTPAQDQACQGFSQISGVNCNEGNSGAAAQSSVGGTVNTVVKILSMVAGALGIIFIMLSGFKYITSGGDQNRVASAKTTLVYALIGLAVAGLSQVLIHMVLSNASSI